MTESRKNHISVVADSVFGVVLLRGHVDSVCVISRGSNTDIKSQPIGMQEGGLH